MVTKWGIRGADGSVIADDFATSEEAATIARSLWRQKITPDWTLFYYTESEDD